MNERELLTLARSVLTLPTAPYHEHAVRARVEEYCRGLGLRVERDRVGNVIVRYRHRAGRTPLVFVAHMDHPGFESLGGKRAEFLGGVPPELFKNAGVRFYRGLECGGLSAHSIIRTKVRRTLPGWPRRKLVELEVAVGKGDFGMWDVPAYAVRDGRLRAAAIDDVLSVAVVLALLAEVQRRKLATHVWGVFTRAEEVGFHGALELAKARRIPREAVVVSLEMSRARPWARIGGGPVVRVGDRMTTFDATATYFLTETARRSAIRAQRCLMDGGSCEATAFGADGYRVGGLCLALGNYHNIGAGRQIRAEYVSVEDLVGLVQLTVAAAREWPRFDQVAAGLRSRVKKIKDAAPRELKDE